MSAKSELMFASTSVYCAVLSKNPRSTRFPHMCTNMIPVLPHVVFQLDSNFAPIQTKKILKCRGVLFVVVAFSKHFAPVSFLVIQNVFTESVFR